MKQYQNRQSKRTFKRTKRRRKISLDLSFLKKILNLRFLASLTCLAALGALGYLAAFSEYFMIKDVAISGNESIRTDEVESVVRETISGNIYGYLPARNFWLINDGAIAEKIRAAFPEIDSLIVSKSFPAGINLIMTEKQPALIWCRDNCYFVNDQGTAYLPANSQDLDDQRKHYLKIIEESPIAEELSEGSPDVTVDESRSSDEAVPENQETAGDDGEDEAMDDAIEPMAVASNDDAVSAISANEQVSDENFIRFALDVNTGISRSGRLTVKYYKTKGYKTRELIAYTDNNIRLYFDATQDAGKQTGNLDNFIEKGIEKENVTGLKYIYLKNTDRVFYK